MPTPLPAPFDREVLVFVGKGGVGKTTTASAVALRGAESGRRTLLVTVDPAQRLEDALGVPVGHRIKEVAPKLDAMMLDPQKVIDDYLRTHAPDQDLTQHPLYKYLSNYMPGINELMAIGQLIEVREERDYDTIVIDTAPTGHALSFLSTPLKIRDLLRENTLIKWALRAHTLLQRLSKSGRWIQQLLGVKDLPPVVEVDFEAMFEKVSRRAGEIHELLQDPKRTSLFIVTLPEKLPVEETVDLHTYLGKELNIQAAGIIVNKFTLDPLAAHDAEFDRFTEDKRARQAIAETMAEARYPAALVDALVQAARFNEVRHRMNVEHAADLARRLPKVARRMVPLEAEDVYGLDRLRTFHVHLFERQAQLPMDR